MDIEWLEDFLVLSDLSSFTRAAQARNVTQSAFSRRIRSLEDWIGIPLIDRDTIPPRLTMAGHLFRDSARAMVMQLQDTRLALGHRSRVFSGIKLFVAHSLVESVMPAWIGKVCAQISGLKFDVQTGETYEGTIALSGGRCDLLMVYQSSVVPMSIDDRTCPSILLGEDRLVPVCRPDADGAPQYLLLESRVRQLPILCYPPETFFGRICNALIRFRPSDPSFNFVVQSPSPEVLLALALDGAGIAWLPQRSVQRDIAAGRLTFAGSAEWNARIDIRLYAQQERARLLHANLWENIRDMQEVNLAAG